MKLAHFAICVMTGLVLTCCGGSTTPDDGKDPDPTEPVEYYDYAVTYVRPEGSIVRPEEADPLIFNISFKNNTLSMPYLAKVNDYEFAGTILRLPTHRRTEGDLLPNRIYVVDKKRWVSTVLYGSIVYGKPHTVGNTFKLKNLTTGVEVVLTNITVNTLFSCPVYCDEQMAKFWTLRGGEIVNAWPY